jgi:hypothetical protein
MRLQGQDSGRVEGGQVQEHANSVLRLWSSIFED